MPTLVATYFAVYIAFCLWAYYEDATLGQFPSWFGFAEVAGNVSLLLAGLSFWLPSVRGIAPAALLLLFVAGCALFVVQGFLTGRRHIQDATLSGAGKKFVALSGGALGAFLNAPLLYWGWQATVGLVHAET